MGENFTVLNTYAFESKDYQVTATNPWNYGLNLPSNKTADEELTVDVRGLQKGHHPFSYDGTPVMIKAQVSF